MEKRDQVPRNTRNEAQKRQSTGRTYHSPSLSPSFYLLLRPLIDQTQPKGEGKSAKVIELLSFASWISKGKDEFKNGLIASEWKKTK